LHEPTTFARATRYSASSDPERVVVSWATNTDPNRGGGSSEIDLDHTTRRIGQVGWLRYQDQLIPDCTRAQAIGAECDKTFPAGAVNGRVSRVASASPGAVVLRKCRSTLSQDGELRYLAL